MLIRRAILVAAGLFLVVAPALAGGERPRVISISLCADQFALALLDRDQIVSLSRQANDPELSLHWRKARGIPRNRGSAEEIVLSGADIVISNAWGVSKTRDFLEAEGIRVVTLPLLEDLDRIVTLTVDIARQLGVEQRGRRLVEDFRRRLAVVHAGWRPEKPRALYLSPGGTTGGAGSFGNRVLIEGGTRNIAAEELGKTGWASIGLEEAVLADPDLLVLSFFREQSWSMTQRMRFHSAFKTLAERTPRATVPGETWICSAWFLINAVEAVADGVPRHAAGGSWQ
jgi:iron complex transport system substrate-binding protein